MESSNEFLGTERIGKLMQKYAIPCIISLLVGALYNIVDQIFIANGHPAEPLRKAAAGILWLGLFCCSLRRPRCSNFSI